MSSLFKAAAAGPGFLAARKRTGRANFQRRLFAGAAALLVLSGLPAAAAQRKADLTRLVVVGDSLSAGFQNFSLHEGHQPNGIAALIAKQARTPMVLPLIAAPGIPNVLQLVSLGPPPVIVEAGGVSLGRVDMLPPCPGCPPNPKQPTNLAVPAARVQDAISTRPNIPIDDLTDLVLGFPGLLAGVSKSQVEWAQALSPTTVIFWLGNNDVLLSAMEGTTAGITPIGSFGLSYIQALQAVSTGATVVVANIPDVTRIPYFTPVAKLAAQFGVPLPLLMGKLGVGPADFITLRGVAMLPVLLATPGPTPLDGKFVLDPGEADIVRATVRAYNTIIAAAAAGTGATLVDVYSLVNEIADRGYVVNDRRLTVSFLDGLFSLDGIHPTNTGNAILANEFIKTMNRRLAAGISPLSVEQVAKVDPLVLPGAGQPASGGDDDDDDDD